MARTRTLVTVEKVEETGLARTEEAAQKCAADACVALVEEFVLVRAWETGTAPDGLVPALWRWVAAVYPVECKEPVQPAAGG